MLVNWHLKYSRILVNQSIYRELWGLLWQLPDILMEAQKRIWRLNWAVGMGLRTSRGLEDRQRLNLEPGDINSSWVMVGEHT